MPNMTRISFKKAEFFVNEVQHWTHPRSALNAYSILHEDTNHPALTLVQYEWLFLLSFIFSHHRMWQAL